MWSSEYPQLTSCKHARGCECVLKRLRVLKNMRVQIVTELGTERDPADKQTCGGKH